MSNGPSGTELLDDWAGRIASAAAPDEIDFAGHTARVYTRGGRGRRVLLRPAPSVPAGTGGALAAAVLPMLWDALAASYALLKAALGSSVLANTISASALLLALSERRDGGPAPDATPGPEPEPAPGPGATGGPEPDADEAAELAVLAGAVVEVSRCLQARGMRGPSADQAAARAVAALHAGRDAGALAFLALLAGVRAPDAEEPAAASGARAGLRRLAARLPRPLRRPERRADRRAGRSG
ncbi:hypothetical protein ABZ915_02725 [Streptomyces sp. NPDC046915]|uniref:hypothetical protein n=1 Tax=Streptomyces sp. NPDC046915 TaxID=3155257 RepID=UPI0033FC7226